MELKLLQFFWIGFVAVVVVVVVGFGWVKNNSA
jgi:hypothetical protein